MSLLERLTKDGGRATRVIPSDVSGRFFQIYKAITGVMVMRDEDVINLASSDDEYISALGKPY